MLPHVLSTPILFLIFKRLDTTKLVFEAIRQVKPPKLYIGADGYRLGHKGEKEKIREVREYVLNNIDWDCEVKTLFRDENMGCGPAITGALNWFFGYEEAGIILEDDLLPDQSFFQFCEELLERYQDEPKVLSISGNYFAGEKNRPKTSYYFSHYLHVWGWATWRRAWLHYDRQMVKWAQLRDTDFLNDLSGGDRHFANYWSRIFDLVWSGKLDTTWDYQFIFATWVMDGLSIMPNRNLVKNIGFDINATHTIDESTWLANLPLERMEFPIVHPAKIERNHILDSWSDQNVFEIGFFSSLKSWFILHPGGDALSKVYRFMRKYFSKIKWFLRKNIKSE